MSQLATERRPATGQQAQWASIEQVPERMRRMLEQTLGSFATPALLSEAAAWTPPVDIEEEDDAYVIEAEVPGAKREDVNIELQGNELAITGEIKERERKGILRRNTRRVGRFDYRVTLPSQRRSQEDRRQTQRRRSQRPHPEGRAGAAPAHRGQGRLTSGRGRAANLARPLRPDWVVRGRPPRPPCRGHLHLGRTRADRRLR